MTDLPLTQAAIGQPGIEAAIRRLNAALGELEAVVERRQEHDRSQQKDDRK